MYELIMRGHFTQEFPDAELVLGDISWQTVEMKIASLMPDFSFWVGSHFLGSTDEGNVISFHFLDVARNTALDASYGSQSNAHLEASLWNEVQVRYLQQQAVARMLINQLRREEVDVI